jgi:hypothetical protein
MAQPPQGINLMKILLTLVAWIACVATWQTQSSELIALDRVRARARAARLKEKELAGTIADARLKNAPAGMAVDSHTAASVFMSAPSMSRGNYSSSSEDDDALVGPRIEGEAKKGAPP